MKKALSFILFCCLLTQTFSKESIHQPPIETSSLSNGVEIFIVILYATSLLAGIFSSYVVLKLRFWNGLMQQLIAFDAFALLGLIVVRITASIFIFSNYKDLKNNSTDPEMEEICHITNILGFCFDLGVTTCNTSMLLLYVFLKRWTVFGNKLIRYDIVRWFFVVSLLSFLASGVYTRNLVNTWHVTPMYCIGVAFHTLIIINQLLLWCSFAFGVLCMVIATGVYSNTVHNETLLMYNNLYFWMNISFLVVHLPPVIIQVVELAHVPLSDQIFGISNNWTCVQNVTDGLVFYFLVFKRMHKHRAGAPASQRTSRTSQMSDVGKYELYEQF